MQIFVSIVVPVYNVESYLRQCLDSLLTGQGDDLEVIVVNDCSPDGCDAILKEYQKKHLHLNVITHKKNQGVSAARNTGVLNALGKYVLFVDPDDSLADGAVETLKSAVVDTDADIIMFGHRRVSSDGILVKETAISTSTVFDLTRKKDFKNGFDCFAGNLLAWNGLYKRKLVKDLKFKSFSNGEDVLFGVESFCRAKRVRTIKAVLYNYLQRSESASKVASAKHCSSSIHVCQEIVKTVREHEMFECLKPMLFRKVRAMSHGMILDVLSCVPSQDKGKCWQDWFDVFSCIYCGTGLVPYYSRPFYWVVFTIRSKNLVKILFKLPVKISGVILTNSVFLRIWIFLRRWR